MGKELQISVNSWLNFSLYSIEEYPGKN